MKTSSPSDSKLSSGAGRWARRDFLTATAAGVAAFAWRPWPAMAGPFTRADFEKLVPADKRLRPAWVRSLFDRGEPTVYRGADLRHIGMPVGGLCAGQLYLGGDGRLWHWDIFNRFIGTGADHYAKPMAVASPVDCGFVLEVRGKRGVERRRMDRTGWSDVRFTGQYPIGQVDYGDAGTPVTVRLEAYSPFIPLNTADSSLPCTLLEYTVTNGGTESVEVTLAGWLENAVCGQSRAEHPVERRNRVVREERLGFVESSAAPMPMAQSSERPDILFDDFERESHGEWTAEGDAFGAGPVEMARIPAYQGDVGGRGKRVINSHASAPADEVGARDARTGMLTSRAFVIERNYITFLIGGGSHAGRTCLNLLVDGEVVLSATGANENRMRPASWDVRRWAGKSAQLQIVDRESGAWGNVGVDDIVFRDTPRVPPGPLAEAADFGTMGLGMIGGGRAAVALAEWAGGWEALPEAVRVGGKGRETASRPAAEALVGGVGRSWKLRPGRSVRAVFVLAWHFPNLKLDRLPGGRHYATRFGSSSAVARQVAAEHGRLSEETRRWRDTWYDSTLPHWFLDRTFLNVSILATSTSHRFADGRFYGWEGVGCCPGTCGHVWQYAHAVGRLFPDLERETRERVDFGLALRPDGAILFRGEHNDIPAVDAQAGTILRALREHQHAADDRFLRRNWPKIRRATQWLIARDGNGDGLIEGNQHNTLDTDWFGPVAWLSGLYVAALRAAEEMAREVGDEGFAATCREIAGRGRANLVERLFDGEYFINRPDPRHLDAINSGSGCHIDQVFGQSWAFQVGLGRVLPEQETRAALRALWRYNFTPDVGPYREAYKAGRWYAMAGEAGLLMCTFPRSDWDYPQAKGKGPDWAAGYFNECMNGFEYQVASHMIWEGMVQEGLAITRAVHDRYHGSRRNPWNEIECGDHYARSMASHGIFLAACGYEYHGPKGHLGFAPRLTPERFRAAFTAAEGWGTLHQDRRAGKWVAGVELKWGRLRLRSLAVEVPAGMTGRAVEVRAGGLRVPVSVTSEQSRLTLTLGREVILTAGESVSVSVG